MNSQRKGKLFTGLPFAFIQKFNFKNNYRTQKNKLLYDKLFF
jgi:hypothetical protein